MKKFGEKFQEYRPFSIEHVSIPDTGSRYETKFLELYGLDKARLPEIMPQNEPHAFKTAGGEPRTLRVLRSLEIPTEMKNELDKVVIEIAPTANVYQISPSQQGLADSIKQTLSEFNYYIVELGLNIMLGRKFKIPEFLFEVDVKCDGKDRTDVTAYDITPDDSIKHIKVISGKISLGITKLLKFMLGPIGQVIPDLLSIELNPWEFEWGFDKYLIDAAGKKNYHLYWKIYETNIVQGFNPTMILKARKDVGNISVGARATYKLKAGWLNITPETRTNKMEIKIWPM